MKVIEQLVQHFHARGVLTEREIEYLIKHGYIRRHDLSAARPLAEDDEPDEPTPLFDDPVDDNLDRLGEEMSGVPTGRRAGGKKGGKDKAKPTGHDLTPLAAVLATHLGDRDQYPALLELGGRLDGSTDWQSAAVAVANAAPAKLESALVALFNYRPPALGELWYWCDTTALFEWAEHEDNAGPVADALAALLTTTVPTQVGRLHQLKKLPQVDGLLDLTRARRALLGSLRGLYDRHFARLKVWLVNPDPTGPAAAVWPALPWAFVLQYNACTQDPVGYGVGMAALPVALRPLCWETAWRMAGTELLPLIPTYRTPPPNVADDGWLALLDLPFQCPFEWTV